MRWVLHLFAFAALVAVASWSFSVTYRTKDALRDVARLNRDIAAEREALAVLRAEWAWLNAPDRLTALVAAHGAPLGLEPLTPERFGETAEAPLIEPDDGMDPVALIDLDALFPGEAAPRRSAPAREPAAGAASGRVETAAVRAEPERGAAPKPAPASATAVAPEPAFVAAPAPAPAPQPAAAAARSAPAPARERVDR